LAIEQLPTGANTLVSPLSPTRLNNIINFIPRVNIWDKLANVEQILISIASLHFSMVILAHSEISLATFSTFIGG
jgi:hypothetical protein